MCHACLFAGNGLSAGVTAVTVAFLLALSVGVVIGLGVAWYGMRCGRGPTTIQVCGQQKLQGRLYEEPPETAIPLRDNQAP